MTWERFPDWDTLWVGDNRLARLYRENYYERWSARLLTGNADDSRLYLDPALTWDEAKLVVQTIAGAQLSRGAAATSNF